MKNLYKILLASLIGIGFYSCDEYLDVVPKGYTIPSTYEDFALLLNSSSISQLWDVANTNYLADDAEKTTDESFPTGVTFAWSSEAQKNYYYFNSGPTHPDGEEDLFYPSAYSQIYTFNVVVNNIMDVTDATEEKKSIVKAEALFGRAYNYFKLVTLYAKAYDPATASTDLGMPIVLDEDINATYIRNSVEEVYELILNDLLEAAPLLETYASSISHPTKSSGYLLLSKVYLFMGDFDNALKYANLALENKASFELQDLTQYYAINGGWYERIIDSRTGQPMEDIEDVPENMYLKASLIDFSSGALVSQDLLDIYEKDLPSTSIDKRRDLYLATDSVIIYSEALFPGRTMYVASFQRNAGLMLSDIYLVLAEAEARVGSKDKAMEYINYLRDYRITNNVPLTAGTNEEALIMALEERRREFSFVADFRFQDLKRLNTEPAFAKDVVHVLDGVTYTLPSNDPRYILPLPNSVININPDIPQYDR
ncbi:RagB/SusD family nutrient uptake outer membrane protein [Flavivirga aquimarina]|uniref:RagB/SusD family nutrient uptake outer membrane protein n=1 Tax=Flavivirga aquimarina TaxID=2027862 RepID=A0ABT8WCA1_9FLAO|nr:RagB/SusD family nutrient uptake outer membrane protein [Flavivirga aquimarina]MDO5970774.1 RagB/SusD family nutrient uptake outer membrane protein [Flavivirga aquimarina]